MSSITRARLAGMIDHTVLKPEATPAQIDKLCEEALEFGFAAVCVNPIYVRQCSRLLRGSPVAVATVVGFPLGANHTETKMDETHRAIDEGALEVDMVLRIGDLVAGNPGSVRADIAAVADVVHAASPKHLLKVIFETAVLTDEQIIVGCRCCAEANADYVKTSTGFHPAGGATVHAVGLMHRLASPIKVKASGGIRDLDTALAMVDAGASRLGMSAGVAVVRALPA